MYRVPLLLFVSWLLIFVFACTDNHFYKQSITFENGWPETDSLVADVMIADSTATFELGLYIRHDPTYPYQNIYIQANTYLPDSEQVRSLVPIDLADKQGNWYGKCSQNECRAQVLLQGRAKFEQIGNYQFVFHPFLRIDPIPGINALEFYIVKLE